MTDLGDAHLTCRIDKKVQFSVSGYLRRIEEEVMNSAVYEMPQNIVRICMLYCRSYEKWNPDLKSDHMVIDEESNTVTNTSTQSGTDWGSIYGSTICSAPFKYHWKLSLEKRANEVGNVWNTLIGIYPLNAKNVAPTGKDHNGYFTNISGTGYAFIGSMSAVTRKGIKEKDYGTPFDRKGQVMDMYLDMETKKLSYHIDGKDHGEAYTVEQGEYMLAVSLCNGAQLKLVDD